MHKYEKNKKKEPKIPKCPICKSTGNLTFLGIDASKRKKVYQCKCKEENSRKKIIFYSDQISVFRLNLIKCPQCLKSEFIKFNGNSQRGYICKNTNPKNGHNQFSFRVKSNIDDITLKTYLIYMNPKCYSFIHKLHKNSKRTKNGILKKEDVALCVDLGLSQKIIAAIFQVNQATVSRFIKVNKISCQIRYEGRVRQTGELKERVFYTMLRVNYDGLERVEVED